jgi:hypothetical protein
MPFVRRSTWLNLAIDVAGIVKECFKVDLFEIDVIQIHSSVRIKRIFALNHSKVGLS